MNRETLKRDLCKLEIKEFYLKHIVKSNYWYFSEYLRVPNTEVLDRIDFFKEIVSTNFKISFHSLQIVGSAKVGFSLDPTKEEMLIPFRVNGENSSDIDIAIISEKFFFMYWDKIRLVAKKTHIQDYSYIAKSIFNGYISDYHINNIREVRSEWNNLISNANKELQDKLNILHPITYRLYRSWEDLEDYQLKGIDKIRKKIQGG